MFALTIDTNIVLDMLDQARKLHTSAVELLRLDGEQRCEIRVVSRVFADISHDPLLSRARGLEICTRPLIGTLAEWDVSVWDTDFWATDEEIEDHQRMLALIFPGSDTSSPRQRNRNSDVGHLIGHRKANRDVFVTNDGALMARAKELHEGFGITIMSSLNAVAYVK